MIQEVGHTSRPHVRCLQVYRMPAIRDDHQMSRWEERVHPVRDRYELVVLFSDHEKNREVESRECGP